MSYFCTSLVAATDGVFSHLGILDLVTMYVSHNRCFQDDVVVATEEDFEALLSRDPASTVALGHVPLNAPLFAVVFHRFSNWLWRLNVPESRAAASTIHHHARVTTGVDIHPAAQIGKRFVVDHGFGTVIGETVRLGDDCYVLNGVTLGARGIATNKPGKRHSTIGHRVEIGAFARVFGNIRIGDDVFISPISCVTQDVPDRTRVRPAFDSLGLDVLPARMEKLYLRAQMNLSRACTPLAAVRNMRIKVETMNPGGSHKSRAARYIIADAMKAGLLTPHGKRRIVEKTGGNLGIGLAYEAWRHGIGVDLVIGLSFSAAKRALCEAYGARLVGLDMLQAGAEPKEVIGNLLAEHGDRYLFTDQFQNEANLNAHLIETGPEIVRQIRSEEPLKDQQFILVKGAGTGASFRGIATSLADMTDRLSTVLVEPKECDTRSGVFRCHNLEGTAVGVVPPFLNWAQVGAVEKVDEASARRGQKMLARQVGFFPGLSSGANYAVADRIATDNPDSIIITVAYDAGDALISRHGS